MSPPEPSILWGEQCQFSQSVLLGQVFHPLNYFCDPLLDELQQVHISLVLITSCLYTVLQVRSHQHRLDHFPEPADHTSSPHKEDIDHHEVAPQYRVGYLG